MSQYKNYTTKKSTTTKASKLVTPQSAPIPGRESEMARNNAGGYTFVVDDMTRLDRFLILGSESSTCHVGKMTLTEQNAANVKRLFASEQGVAAVNRIVEISDAGRAHKNEPALFALALAFAYGTPETKAAASAALPKVARTGTHMFTLASYIHDLRGWGRTVRRGFASWYNDRSPMSLATQLTKYANRNGWTHKDVLRLAHVRPSDDTRNGLFAFAVGKESAKELPSNVAEYLRAVQVAKTSKNEKEVVALIKEFGLSHEVINTELLNSPKVWEAMLPTLGLTALIRNLGKMTSIGLIGQTGDIKKFVMNRLTDVQNVQDARIHPLSALTAQRTYQTGRGLLGNLSWNPVSGVTSALEDMFYSAFKNVEPTGKSRGIFLDTSGSMGCESSVKGLTCRDIAAVMSMVTVRTEQDTVIRGFTSNTNSWSPRATGVQDLGVGKNDTLDTVIRKVSASNWGGTDCSLPMTWAKKNGVQLDSFEIYTDNDTWAGNIQPVQALRNYRQTFNRDARMVVAATLATPFTIADPTDKGCLDVVGFDSASPQIIADFVRGNL